MPYQSCHLRLSAESKTDADKGAKTTAKTSTESVATESAESAAFTPKSAAKELRTGLGVDSQGDDDHQDHKQTETFVQHCSWNKVLVFNKALSVKKISPSSKWQGFGGHSTEAAFMLITQLPRVQILALPRFFLLLLSVSTEWRLNPSSA